MCYTQLAYKSGSPSARQRDVQLVGRQWPEMACWLGTRSNNVESLSNASGCAVLCEFAGQLCDKYLHVTSPRTKRLLTIKLNKRGRDGGGGGGGLLTVYILCSTDVQPE